MMNIDIRSKIQIYHICVAVNGSKAFTNTTMTEDMIMMATMRFHFHPFAFITIEDAIFQDFGICEIVETKYTTFLFLTRIIPYF